MKRLERGCVCLVAQLCLILCDPMDCSPPGSSVHGDSPGKNTLLQGIFPTQRSNPGPPHCGQILYRLSHWGRVGKKKKSRSLRKTDQWGHVESEGRVIQENQVLMEGWSDPLHQIQSSTMRMKNEPLNLAV